MKRHLGDTQNEKELYVYQFSFKSGRSINDAIHTITQVMEKCHNTVHNTKLMMLFVDFQSAFGSINREELRQD